MATETNPYSHLNMLAGKREMDKYRLLLGTEEYATPANTFVRYGFDLTKQSMSEYIIMYSPIMFADKSYQDLLRFKERHRLAFKEKAMCNETIRHLHRYFKVTMRECDANIQVLLDLFDEAQDEWQKVMENMHLSLFNITARYFKDEEACRKLCDLLVAYSWLNYGGDVREYLRVKQDSDERLAQLEFCKLLNYYIDGIKANDQEILAKVRREVQPSAVLVFKRLMEIADKRKAVEGKA